MNCLCCEQPIDVVSPGDDSRGVLPNIVGGDIVIHFGYGSAVHDCLKHQSEEHQSAICDTCWEKKKHLVRTVPRPSPRPPVHSPWCGAHENNWVTGITPECTCINNRHEKEKHG